MRTHKTHLKTSEVKLIGGSGPHEGNIFVGGLPVCDDLHDAENAVVVCRFQNVALSHTTMHRIAIGDIEML